MGVVKRFCPDCGSRLVYNANLSNPKAPNEHRVLTYQCMNCTKTSEKPTLIAIKRSNSDDPIQTMKVIVVGEIK